MDAFKNINDGKYKNPTSFPTKPEKPKDPNPRQSNEYAEKLGKWRDEMRKWKAETRRLEREVFRKDLAEEFGMTDHPKEEKVWNKAWEEGRSSGLMEVYYEYQELVGIAK